MISKEELLGIINGFGFHRMVSAVFTGGSRYLGVSRPDSDYDLTAVLEETEQDLLFRKPINVQHKIEYEDEQGEKQKLDLKIVGTRSLYKQLSKMNPNVFPLVLQDTSLYPLSFINPHIDSAVRAINGGAIGGMMTCLNPTAFRNAIRGMMISVTRSGSYKQIDMLWHYAQFYQKYVLSGKACKWLKPEIKYPLKGFTDFHHCPDFKIVAAAGKITGRIMKMTEPYPKYKKSDQEHIQWLLLNAFALRFKMENNKQLADEIIAKFEK